MPYCFKLLDLLKFIGVVQVWLYPYEHLHFVHDGDGVATKLFSIQDQQLEKILQKFIRNNHTIRCLLLLNIEQ